MNLAKKLNKEKYVSFDIFDTLLFRYVNDVNEVFYKVESKLIGKYGDKYVGFRNERILAEKKASTLNKVDYTLEDIYEFLNIAENLKKEVMHIEMAVEMEQLYPNNYLIDIISELRKNNVKIIIATDMYLPKGFIERLLEKNKIKYDYLYVSNDIQVRKSRGTMFKYILNDLNINKKDLIHIGDNYRSDYLMPKLCGIKSIHYNNKVNGKYKDLYMNIGYSMFGPCLYDFCKEIHNRYKNIGADSICFLARDGQIVSKAYNKIYKDKTSYVYASRRSLTVPLLQYCKNMNDVLLTVPYIKRIEEVDNLLHKLGIDDKDLKELIKSKFGEEITKDMLLSPIGDEIFSIIREDMVNNSVKEFTAAEKYISNNILGKKIILVDIGWYGTMQKCIEKITDEMNIDKEYYGVYFGLIEKKDHSNDDIKATGYEFNFKSKEKCYDEGLIHGFNGLIELMFTADHGSTKKYICEPNGDARYILEDNIGEYSDFVKVVQFQALKYIEDINEQKCKSESKFDSFEKLYRLLSNPKIYECDILGDLMFYDAYFEKLIQYDGITNFLKNPHKGIKQFLNSNWKIGYIKKMFPIFSPSFIYKVLNKIK